MRVLVTGGAGFIGFHVVRKLLSVSYEVTVVDDLRHGLRSNVPEEASFVYLDINSPLFSDVLQRGGFDCIVHLAAQTRVDVSIQHPQTDTEENVMATVRLLEGARAAGIRRIVMASSAAVYGDPAPEALPLTEEQPLRPLSFYGLSKMTAESYLQMYSTYYGMEYVALRFANVYGERAEIDDEGGVVNVFAKRMVYDMPITLYGDGQQSRDYIYAGDIADGIAAAIQTDHVNTAYNLSTGQEATLHQVLTMLRRISGKDVQPFTAAARSGDIYRSVLSNQKAAEMLGWKPRVLLEEGLSRTYRYFLERSILHSIG